MNIQVYGCHIGKREGREGLLIIRGRDWYTLIRNNSQKESEMWTVVYLLGLVMLLLLFAPQWGMIVRWRQRRWLRSREAIEDALMHLHQREHQGRRASVESVAGALGVPVRLALMLIQRMESQGLLRTEAAGLTLTPDGHRLAVQVVRAHRLFERYLAYETSIPPHEVHDAAHRFEHSLTPQQLEQLDAYMGHPLTDPHGDPIPSASGEISEVRGQSLVDLPTGKPAQIVHVEDEPAYVYAQIVAEGLRPGMVVTVIDRSPTRIELESESDEHVLAPVVAANITVREAVSAARPTEAERLGSLQPGERAKVVRIDDACQGLTRRRFLDLGITPGTEIEVVMRSPFGDPTAYRVRGSLIALRREQADWIWVQRDGESSHAEERSA